MRPTGYNTRLDEHGAGSCEAVLRLDWYDLLGFDLLPVAQASFN
jgi:hypothetical protein